VLRIEPPAVLHRHADRQPAPVAGSGRHPRIFRWVAPSPTMTVNSGRDELNPFVAWYKAVARLRAPKSLLAALSVRLFPEQLRQAKPITAGGHRVPPARRSLGRQFHPERPKRIVEMLHRVAPTIGAVMTGLCSSQATQRGESRRLSSSKSRDGPVTHLGAVCSAEVAGPL
jgi:hypothetical protein